MSQEQVNALNVALIASQEQVMGLSQQLDQLRADATATAQGTTSQLELLRAESSDAVANLRAQVAELEAGKGSGGGKHEHGGNRLLNLKEFEPTVFSGKDGGNVKVWQKQVRQHCNAKQKGFKTALEWAEAQPTEITNADLLGTDCAPI